MNLCKKCNLHSKKGYWSKKNSNFLQSDYFRDINKFHCNRLLLFKKKYPIS